MKCRHQVAMPRDGIFYCRNEYVTATGNLVPVALCNSCPFADKDHPQRPAPEINPGFLQQLQNFRKAAAKQLTSMEMASAELRAEREKVCRGGCAFWSAELQRCQHAECGCVSMSTKWSWKSSVCPEKKWPEEEQELKGN